MPVVGEVVFAPTNQRIGNSEWGMKHHFCVGAVNRIYLFVCKRQFQYDFPITKVDCCGLELEESYISLVKPRFVPDDKLRSARTRTTCAVSADFLERFRLHVVHSPFLNEKDRRVILKELPILGPASE